MTTEFPFSGVIPLSVCELTPLKNEELGCGGIKTCESNVTDCARSLLELSKTTFICLFSSPRKIQNMVISSQIIASDVQFLWI